MRPLLALFLLFWAAGAALAAAPGRNPDLQSAKIIQTVAPVFPESLYRVYAHGGEARMVINVDERGKLKDSLIVGYTDPKFAELALDAVKQWKFEAARFKGDPVPVCIELAFSFQVSGIVISMSPSEADERFFWSMFNESGAYRLYSLGELDHAPVPVRADSPPYPKSLADEGVKGEVTVGFYIDERGNVRMPRVVAWRENRLANLAVEGVQHWKFQPPLHNGRPVPAYVQQVFRFGLGAATN